MLWRQLSPPFVSTTMPSLPNELWWEILPHAISHESTLAMVKPSSEHLHPFFPGKHFGFLDPQFYGSQFALWKLDSMVAHNFVQVNRVWRAISERFLYSTFYVNDEWRVQRFIDTIKLNPNLAEKLRTLVIMRSSSARGVKAPCLNPLVVQVLRLCHGIAAIVTGRDVRTSPLPLFQSLDSSRRLLLLSAIYLQNEEFPTFMINSNHYASLQVLELAVYSLDSHALPSIPEHITFPSLRTLVLGCLGRPYTSVIPNVVGKWELPSLKEFSTSHWIPLISTPLLPLIQQSYDRLEFLDAPIDLLHDHAFYDLIRAPPFHLRRLTLKLGGSTTLPPPMHPATKSLFLHVVVLGISECDRLCVTNVAGSCVRLGASIDVQRQSEVWSLTLVRLISMSPLYVHVQTMMSCMSKHE